MQPVPRIFVSATSRDLKTARGLVSEGLRRMECLPIVQDDFPPDYKSVREMLRTKLETCDAVVHLAGFYYGAEPQPVLEGSPDRRSFTQMEYEIAVELGLPCYVFLCGEKFPFDEHEPEPEDKRALQLAHRGRLLERDELYYEFETREDLNSRTRELQLSVEGLREELAKERARRRLTLVVSAVALLVALAGGIFLFAKSQSQEAVIAETTEKLGEQGELIAQLLAEQERLRAERGDFAGLAAEAEANVAKATNQSAEEVRAKLNAAIVESEVAVTEARAAGDDGVLAAALLKLAEVELAAGRQTEAVEAFRERLELLDREANPVEWADTAAVLAKTLFWRDVQSAEPREFLREGVEWARGQAELGPDHPATLRMMLPLSVMVEKEEAVELAGHVLAVRERELGSDDEQTLEAALVLARRYKVEGDFAAADELFERVVAARERLYGPKDQRTLKARWDLAYSLEAQRRFSEAESRYRELAELSAEAVGEGHEDTLGFAMSLAFLYDARGDEAKATRMYRECVAAAEEFGGMDGKMTQLLANNLAVRLIDNAEYVEAERLSRRVLESRIRTIGVNQPLTIDSMGTVALALVKQGKVEEYKEVMGEKITAEIRVFGPDAPVVAMDQFQLALNLASNDQWGMALPYFEESYVLRKRVLGADAAETFESLDMLLVGAMRVEDWEATERWGGEALAAYEGLAEPPAEGLAGTLYRLAVSQEELGKTDAALEFAQRAAEAAAGVPSEHWLHERTAEMVGRLQ